jgi:FkbM family methyltransferase
MAVVVQIGTNTGNDHVRNLCREIKPAFILLVEPFDVHHDSIKKNYAGIPHVAYEHVAIMPIPMDATTLYFADRDGPSGHPLHTFEVTSVVPDHLLKHGYAQSELKSVTVNCKTMSQLLATYSLKRIDYLFLDIEGIDFEVLKSIDFDAYDIRNLQIEFLHLDRTELVTFMAGHGYAVGTSLHANDMMFVKLI